MYIVVKAGEHLHCKYHYFDKDLISNHQYWSHIEDQSIQECTHRHNHLPYPKRQNYLVILTDCVILHCKLLHFCKGLDHIR